MTAAEKNRTILARAITENPLVFPVAEHTYDVMSRTSYGHVYRVTPRGCNCPAGERGQTCWHFIYTAAVERGIAQPTA